MVTETVVDNQSGTSRADQRRRSETDLTRLLNLPTYVWIELKREMARVCSLGLAEPVYVYYVEGDYWYGTQRQIVDNGDGDRNLDVIYTYFAGQLASGTCAYDLPVRDYNDGSLGGGGKQS